MQEEFLIGKAINRPIKNWLKYVMTVFFIFPLKKQLIHDYLYTEVT